MFGKLLLPLDPSKRLKAATDYALTLARRLELPLVAAYIANPTKIGAGSGMRDPKECFYPLGDRELKRFAASVTDVAVEPLLRCGERPQVLSHMVTEEQVGDTLVLGPFRSRLTRFFTGSEVERILEDVQCHAFVIREEQPLPGPGAPALVAFDGPQLPDAAPELIERLAQSFGCDLELLHLGEDIHGGAAALDEAVQELRGKLGGEFHVTSTIVPLRGLWRRRLAATNRTIAAEGARLVVLPDLEDTVSVSLLHELVLDAHAPVCVLR